MRFCINLLFLQMGKPKKNQQWSDTNMKMALKDADDQYKISKCSRKEDAIGEIVASMNFRG